MYGEALKYGDDTKDHVEVEEQEEEYPEEFDKDDANAGNEALADLIYE